MDLGTPLSVARRVKLGIARAAARRAVQRQDARRGGGDPAGAARTSSRASLRELRALGRLARRRDRRRGDQPSRRDDARSTRRATLTFAEVHRRSNALARALADEGVEEGDGVAIMCRNHRGFIDATLACAKLGANGLYMNTAFSGPQLAGVVEREGPAALIYDQEFAELLGEAARTSSASSAGARTASERRHARSSELIESSRRRRPISTRPRSRAGS